jgi:hypothetical protein
VALNNIGICGNVESVTCRFDRPPESSTPTSSTNVKSSPNGHAANLRRNQGHDWASAFQARGAPLPPGTQICEYDFGFRIKFVTFDTIGSKLKRGSVLNFFHAGSDPNAFHLAFNSERSGKLSM